MKTQEMTHLSGMAYCQKKEVVAVADEDGRYSLCILKNLGKHPDGTPKYPYVIDSYDREHRCFSDFCTFYDNFADARQGFLTKIATFRFVEGSKY